jgi:hypothetical protein
MKKFDIDTNAIARQQAARIALKLDQSDGQDHFISKDTWKYAMEKYGAKKINIRISVFNAEKSIAVYIKRELEKNGGDARTIGEKWYNELVEFTEKGSNSHKNIPIEQVQKKPPQRTLAPKAADLKADSGKNIKSQPAKVKPAEKEVIVAKMYEKWSSNFKNSNLDINFYNKLYDFIKLVHCEIDDEAFDSKNYSSKEEQTMDEVIAVLAGESSLNSKAKYYIYRGIFQLDAASLTTVKKMGEKYDLPGINQDINLAQFANLSGEKQLDYLIGHLTYAKIRSGILSTERITPQQLWAMIKLPNRGQRYNNLVQQKSRCINKIFDANNIKRGIVT